LQPDGKILVAGIFTSIGGQQRKFLARLHPTSGLADSFNPNPTDQVTAIAVQPNGKILVGGFFRELNFDPSIGGQPRDHIARLDPVTGLADSLDLDANQLVNVIVVQPDGKILAGGFFSSIGQRARLHIARIDPHFDLSSGNLIQDWSDPDC
jgi:streptogramin lyase